MERLTYRDRFGNVMMAFEHEEKYTEREWIDMLETRLAAYEDIKMEPEDIAKVQNVLAMFADATAGVPLNRLRELAQADREGRVVVLPFPQHKTLFDMSDLGKPEILKDFRIAAAWTHCGIVFHSPWNIFLQHVEQGHIKQVSDGAEKALGGGGDG